MGFIQYNSSTVVDTNLPQQSVTDLSTWASRPTGSDGDVGVASTGQVYIYSETAAEWVRPVVYNGTMTWDAHLVGTENSIADLEGTSIGKAWVDGSNSTAHTVTSDGTRCTVEFAGTAGSSTRITWFYTDVSAMTNGIWFSGYCSIDIGYTGGAATTAGVAISGLGTTPRGALIGDYNNTSPILRIYSETIYSSPSTTGTNHVYDADVEAATAFDTERWVEVIGVEDTSSTDTAQTWVYVDHAIEPIHVKRGPFNSFRSVPSIGIRLRHVNNLSQSGKVILRQFKGGGW